MNVNKEIAAASAKLVIEAMLNSRISKLLTETEVTKKYAQLMGITFEQVREATGYNAEVEALAAAWLGLMPDLDVRGTYDELMKQRLAWAKPKPASPRAQF